MRDTTNWCCCKGHCSQDFTKLTDCYTKHFIPEGWRLDYGTLSEYEPGRVLYITGRCNQCAGYMQSGASIPSNLTGDTLLEYILREMRRRPYDGRDSTGVYHGPCAPRQQWYWEQDHLTAPERREQFISLFREADREHVRTWAQAHIQGPVFRRDTAADLFRAVVDWVQREGFWPEQSAFLYCQPDERSYQTALCDYRFHFWPELNFGGAEGVYIDCVLHGAFDASGRDTLHIGTIRTACTDRDTCLTMGALTGALLYYGREYLELNQQRFAPDAELEAESKKQKEA